MFNLSTRVQYGLEIMEALASRPVFDPEGLRPEWEVYVSLADIAKQMGRSANYLQQIIKPLKVAGLLTSKEGVTGGIRLAKSPKEISLYEVLIALDGEVRPISCLADDHVCPTKEICGHRKYWSNITTMLEQQFKQTTLLDLSARS